MSKGGKTIKPDELDRINLECDLISLINNHAWPHGEKVTRLLMDSYHIRPKHNRPISVSAKPE